MKKGIIWTIILMAVATTVSVAIVSCKKDNENNMNDKSSNVMGMSSNDPMNEYLISFKEKLLSAQNGEEFLSLEQAQRDLGNLLNFDFGDANYATNVFQYDTIYAKVAISEGKVDLSQLAVTYNDLHKLIDKAYQQVNLPEKSVYAIYCTFDQEAINSETVDVMILLTTRGLDFTSKGMCTVSPFKNSIDMTDCWHVFRRLGRCDFTDYGYDHVRILQLVYNNNIMPIECNDGQLYYTDIDFHNIKATEYQATGTSHYDYKLWVGDYSEWYDGTVDYYDMAYYYNNLCDIIDEKMDNLDDDEFRVTDISCTALYDTISTYYEFECKVEYGKPHCTGSNN